MRLKIIFPAIIAILILVSAYFFAGTAPEQKNITWGVNFSQKQASELGLNWAEVYLALLDDLKVRNIKLAVYWDLIEPEEQQYFFNDLDWQVQKAESYGAKLILVVGMKTPRWPECHIPQWAENKSKDDQQTRILNMIEKIAERYKNSPALEYWQIENEPFFSFGNCPWVDKSFLEKEIKLVKEIDSRHPIIISDSGEGSLWITAAKLGDVVGTTLYRKVWFTQANRYWTWPFNPTYYWKHAALIKKFFRKNVIIVELQAEPWGPQLLYQLPPEEQKKTMNLEKFRQNIDFARKTGLDKFYFWGTEWWYWMKVRQGQPEIWNEAKKLF